MRANDPVRVLRRWRYHYATTLQVARELGVSERTADAWLSMLASEGKVKRARVAGGVQGGSGSARNSAEWLGRKP